MKRAQLYRVSVYLEGQDGIKRWQLVTPALTHGEALRIGNEHERAGRRAMLVDDKPTSSSGCAAPAEAAQIDLLR